MYLLVCTIVYLHCIYLVIVKAIDLYPRQVFIVQHFSNSLHFPILARVTLIIIVRTASYTMYTYVCMFVCR